MAATLTQDPALIRRLFADFFAQLFEDPELRTGFAGVGKVLEMRYHDPEICFLLDLRGADPSYQDVTGLPVQPSDIQVGMAWPTAHEFWKDNLDVVMAFLSQRIKATGSTEALLHLRPHFKSASRLYANLSEDLAVEGSSPVVG
ncbi:MAG: hypothetical protein ABI743_07990 [bacterium]